MSKSEEFIEKRFGRETPFTVPEDYFAQLQSKVLESLPERETKVIKMTPRRSLKPLVTIAASVCVAVFGLTVWLHQMSSSETNIALSESTEFNEMLSSYDESTSEYVFMDTDDMYAYLSQQ